MTEYRLFSNSRMNMGSENVLVKPTIALKQSDQPRKTAFGDVKNTLPIQKNLTPAKNKNHHNLNKGAIPKNTQAHKSKQQKIITNDDFDFEVDLATTDRYGTWENQCVLDDDDMSRITSGTDRRPETLHPPIEIKIDSDELNIPYDFYLQKYPSFDDEMPQLPEFTFEKVEDSLQNTSHDSILDFDDNLPDFDYTDWILKMKD